MLFHNKTTMLPGDWGLPGGPQRTVRGVLGEAKAGRGDADKVASVDDSVRRAPPQDVGERFVAGSVRSVLGVRLVAWELHDEVRKVDRQRGSTASR